MTIIYDSGVTHRYQVRASGIDRWHRFLWVAKVDAFLIRLDGDYVRIIDHGKEGA